MALVIGLTGGIATGKSTVARMLRELGAEILDADAVVHELQAPGAPLLAEMARCFGADILDERGALRRELLAERVFGDAEARRRLEALIHPRVGAELARRLAEARRGPAPLIVLDVPLLLEGARRQEGGRGGLAAAVALVVVVYAPESQQIARLGARDALAPEEARRRLAAQLPIEEKRRLADRVIDNSGGLAETERQVRALFSELVSAPPQREVSPC